jgi:hypothetical protein
MERRMLENKTIKNDAVDPLKAWRQYSLVLSGMGVCYLVGVAFIGLKATASTFEVVFHLTPPLLYLSLYLWPVRKALRKDITRIIANEIVHKCFLCGALFFMTFFILYVLKVASNDFANGEVSMSLGRHKLLHDPLRKTSLNPTSKGITKNDLNNMRITYRRS